MPVGQRPDPPQHTARIALSGTVGEARWANVLWALNGKRQQPTIGELAVMATYFFNEYAQRFLPLLDENVHLQSAAVNYYLAAGEQLGGDHVGDQAGGHSGIALPASIAVCVSWSLQQRYKGGHPRTYLPGVTQDRIFNYTAFLPAFTDAIASAAKTFHTNINAFAQGNIDQLELGTVSFVLRKEWRAPPVFRSFVPAQAAVDARVDSQRRRLGPDR